MDPGGNPFTGFLPAISPEALKAKGLEIRRWRIHMRTGTDLHDLAEWINPIVRGWMQYYGAFYHSALKPLLRRINAYLVRWIRRKYKRLAGFNKAKQCFQGIAQRYPRMFAHWRWSRNFW
jgi:RNA-directed DNA polymerase